MKNRSIENLKNYEESKEDSLIKIEINNNAQPNLYETISLSNKSNNNKYNYKDPYNSRENQEKQNLSK